MFGDDWPKKRVFPNTPIRDGESLTFDGVKFTVIDLGPSESPHDSPWVLGDDEKVVFLGDQIYDHKHRYLADGFYAEWLANIQQAARSVPRRRCLPHRSRRPCGCRHVGLATPLHRDVPRRRRRRRLVGARIGKGNRRGSMKAYEPSNELQMLMELSIEPVAAKQGLLTLSA